MNWIIRNLAKLDYHTNLAALLVPLENDLTNLKWVVSDLEYSNLGLKEIPLNYDSDWILLSSSELNEIRLSQVQIVWGVICGVPENSDLNLSDDNLPFIEGNDKIWKNGNLQVEGALLEIIAYDSSYTIVKFTDERMSDKFKAYFNDAIELEKWQWK